MSKRLFVLLIITAVGLIAPSAFADCFRCSTDMVPGEQMCDAEPTGSMSSCWGPCQGTYQKCIEYTPDPGAGGGGGGTWYGGNCSSTDGYYPPSCMTCGGGGMRV